MEDQQNEFEEGQNFEHDPQMDTVENRLEELEIELQAKEQEYLRLLADFDNFRKRTAKERIEFSKVAARDVITDFLPVLDDLDRAMKNINQSSDLDAVKDGVELIEDKLKKVLMNNGLKPIDSVGEAFDPEIHEAITEIPAPTEELKGKVVDELEKGYTLNDKIIRFPKVVVGK